MSIVFEATRVDNVTTISTRRAWVEPLLLVLLLTIWFSFDLGGRPLWAPDEGRYAEIPREMVASGDYLTPRLNGVKYFEKPPLVYWVTASAIKLFGLNEWALRSWLAVFAILGCLAVYCVGRNIHGRNAGLFAAAVLAISPLYGFMGGVLTLDMPVSALLTMALSAFLLGVRAPPGNVRRLLLYAFYTFVALAVLTKGLIGIVIPAMIIGAWIVIVGNWRKLIEIQLPTGILLFLVIAAPWHVLVSQANPEFPQFYFIHEHFERYLTQAHHRYQPAWFFIPVLLLGMYPWTTFLPYALSDGVQDLWRERSRHAETWFLLLWAGVPFAFFSLSSSKLIPYILPTLPPLAILLGRRFATAWNGSAQIKLGPFFYLMLFGALLAGALALAPHIMADKPKVIGIANSFGGVLYVMASGLLLASVLPLLFRLQGNHRMAIIALFAGSAYAIAAVELNVSRLDAGRSIKALALELKADLKASDEVMTYEDYYQDLPVYLERRITTVGWKGELEFGSTVEDMRAWIIDEPTFRKRWLERRIIYLLTSHANIAKLRAAPPGPMCVVHSNKLVVAIVNRECAQ
jgi:4-amino-4-deoxy-L-arabinose transferase-like glycosyltransferase